MVWKELGNVKGEKGENGTSLEFKILDDRIGIKKETDTEYQYTIPLKGESLEFKWDGTKLGVKKETDTEYQYTDLQAQIGEEIEEKLENIKIGNLIEVVDMLPEVGEKNRIYLKAKAKNNKTVIYALKEDLDNTNLLIKNLIEETYKKEEVDSLLNIIEIVDILPEKGKTNCLYFIKTNTDSYNVYAYVNKIWLKLNPNINLNEYLTSNEVEDLINEKLNERNYNLVENLPENGTENTLYFIKEE